MKHRTGVLQYAPTLDQFLKEESSSIEDPSLKGESTPIASTEDQPYFKNKSIWQRNYWEHIIRNEDEYLRIANYIKNNPIKWYNDKLNGGRGNVVMESAPSYGEEIWMV
ncbi:MAG: hypothetical protein KAQ93_08700 [Spirochaetales bacterium]|nr:hypothetical protein [Spirochaetales bacterium]